MQTPIEVYVLCGERSLACAERFLQEFAPDRQATADEFEFPQFADEPTHVFHDPLEVIRALEIDRSQSYSLYWHIQGKGRTEQAMLHFTNDGAMIAGLAGLMEPEVAIVAMQNSVNGQFGYMTGESHPSSTIREFIAICEQSTLPRLFDGRLCGAR